MDVPERAGMHPRRTYPDEIFVLDAANPLRKRVCWKQRLGVSGKRERVGAKIALD